MLKYFKNINIKSRNEQKKSLICASLGLVLIRVLVKIALSVTAYVTVISKICIESVITSIFSAGIAKENLIKLPKTLVSSLLAALNVVLNTGSDAG